MSQVIWCAMKSLNSESTRRSKLCLAQEHWSYTVHMYTSWLYHRAAMWQLWTSVSQLSFLKWGVNRWPLRSTPKIPTFYSKLNSDLYHSTLVYDFTKSPSTSLNFSFVIFKIRVKSSSLRALFSSKNLQQPCFTNIPFKFTLATQVTS